VIDVENRKRGVTYVYESYSYWDKDKQSPRSKRKLIGKRDPETGEIVPTNSKRGRKRGTSNKEPSDTNEVDYKALYEEKADECRERERQVVELRRRVAELELGTERHEATLAAIRRLCDG
jgi:hypothetical protein